MNPPYPADASRVSVLKSGDSIDCPHIDKIEEGVGTLISSMEDRIEALGENYPSPEVLTEAIRSGVSPAVRELLADEELTRRFWLKGHALLAQETQTRLAEVIGRRVLHILIVAAFGLGLYYACHFEPPKFISKP